MPRRIKAKHQHVANLEAEMLRRVRTRGGLSRVELARELKLAPSTAGIYVDRLLRDGFLLETEAVQRETAGRPPTTLVPHPDGGRFVGVDFEARNLMATVVDFSQRPLRQVHKRIRPADSPAQILAQDHPGRRGVDGGRLPARAGHRRGRAGDHRPVAQRGRALRLHPRLERRAAWASG